MDSTLLADLPVDADSLARLLTIAALPEDSQAFYRTLLRALETRYAGDRERIGRLFRVAYWFGQGDSTGQVAERAGVSEVTVRRDAEALRELVEKPPGTVPLESPSRPQLRVVRDG